MNVQLNTQKIFEISEAIPFVSTITSLVALIIKSIAFNSERTSFEKYLKTRTWTYLVLCAIPFVNLIAVLFRKTLLTSSPEIDPLQNVSNQAAVKLLDVPTPKDPTAIFAAASALTARPRAANAKDGDIFPEKDFRVMYAFNDAIQPFIEDPSITFLKHNDKHIVVQESPEGCSAGVAAMVAYDLDKTIPYTDFKSRQSAGWDRIKKDLEGAGLIVYEEDVKACEDAYGKLDIKKLNNLILRYGPACTRIRAKSANIAHWIIIDEIKIDLHVVTIRDPWHGFMADIDLTAFLEHWQNAWDIAKIEGKSCKVIQACLPIVPKVESLP